jgi:prepilin-type N-terminal cleavage/methylation domain-containing protein
MNIFKSKNSIPQTFLAPPNFPKENFVGCHCPARVRAGQGSSKCQKFSRTRGFTLIELLVVISIIGFLSSVVLASMQTARYKAKDVALAQNLKSLQTAMELYRETKGSYLYSNEDSGLPPCLPPAGFGYCFFGDGGFFSSFSSAISPYISNIDFMINGFESSLRDDTPLYIADIRYNDLTQNLPITCDDQTFYEYLILYPITDSSIRTINLPFPELQPSGPLSIPYYCIGV